MNVVIIGHLLPEPASSAAGSRMLQIIHCFREGNHKITFATAAQNVEFSVDLKALGVDFLPITLNSDTFDQQIKALNPAIVLFDRYLTEEQFGWMVAQECPSAVRIIDTEDLHCLRQARREAVESNRPFELADLNNDVSKREVAAIFRSDLSLMISEVEIELLITHFQVKPDLLHYLPFMPEKVVSDQPTFEERENFMTIGNFLHAPNTDSVEYCYHTVWPLIRKRLPSAEMHVFGAYAPQRILQLNKPQKGFFIHGRIDRAEVAFKQARVCLAPLRYGAGMKGKLLEAMQYGTPSVTTTIGAEGMYGELPWAGAIADEPEAIAEAAVMLHENAKQWQEAVQNGNTLLTNRFDAAFHKSQIRNRFNSLNASLATHRERNFIGQMLQHHQHKSTEFMSRFINLKNKTS